ncbi:MAG TPA: Gfo/Idh/MocA family oxidoreductase [Candidatus Hydrogenedentes bacterium]|nr:Gfo/Idh/MocA family oxidoreductase [Candidatus Hydrogenedentota bacterium]HOL76866.1 Gfo/Idh/MocA family oxidoreductase [Candidatus Hydrogenedentota bacterium]HPO85517.1 Gfo/Idh/MocA family oxidoreductase [Candidatus Hydrogenedentota bacterium]
MSVRVGFIGAGGNAVWHMGFLKDIPDAQIVAVTDIAFEKAQAAAEKFGARAYASHKQMLDAEELDCCYISIPPHQHGEPEIDVIHRGLPFFVEKPLALNMALAEDILERVEKRKIGTCVGYQIRYVDVMDKAREMLKKTFVNAVNAHYVCGAIGGWYTRIALSGGQIVEQATHLVDLMRYIFGEIDWVMGTKRTGARVDSTTLDGTALGKGSISGAAAGLELHEYNIWDATTLLMQFRSGIPATFLCSCQVPYMWDVLLDIFATDFRLKITFSKMEILRKVDGQLKSEIVQGDETPKIDATFIEAVKTGDFSKIRSTYQDAVKTLRVTLAAVEAAREGAVVKL